jgi:hypothetical protein
VNPIEQGVTHDGIRPRLIERTGSFYGAATQSDRPMTDVLKRRLSRLGGRGFSTYTVFIKPGEPEDMDDVDISTLVEFIQSAGKAEAMLVEIKRREPDGVLRQYAVGRDADDQGSVTVTWGSDGSATVPTNEVFTADEAHPVHLQWCWDQTIPDGYRLRLLDL